MIPQILCATRFTIQSRSSDPRGEVKRTRVNTSLPNFEAIPFAKLLQFCLLPYSPCSTTKGGLEDDWPAAGSCDSYASLTGEGPELISRIEGMALDRGSAVEALVLSSIVESWI